MFNIQVNSNIKYTANGYLPCNGYVPCQPGHFSPEQVSIFLTNNTINSSMIIIILPCHDYVQVSFIIISRRKI